VQRKARRAFRLWQKNPWHPVLNLKQIHGTRAIYSIRLGTGWRALGVKEGDHFIWFWVGSHADYDNLLKQI